MKNTRRQHTPLKHEDKKLCRYQQTRRDYFLQKHLAPDAEWKLYHQWRKCGIMAEFYTIPPTYTYPNKFTPVDQDTLEGIQVMMREGWVKPVKDWHSQPGHYSKLKLVKKASGKWRFTLACVEINKYTVKRHFKVDDLRTLKQMLEPNMYMALLDIKDAFYSKAHQLHRDCKKFFRFALKLDKALNVYEFQVTPQGWTSSPRAMHIMIREAKKEANSMGILHARATDDIIIVNHSERECGRQLIIMENILRRHNYVTKPEKKRLPNRKQIWFGAKIETSPHVKFTATKDKIKEMKRMATWMLKKDDSRQVTPRMIAGFVGKIRSAALYLECAMAHTYNLIQAQTLALAESGQAWDVPTNLSETARRELIFFKTRCTYPGRHMPTNLIEILLVSDASNSGYGGKILRLPEPWQPHVQQAVLGFWIGDELKMHINEKEHEGSFRVAKGCLNPARDFVQQLTPTIYHLNVLTDNQVSRSYNNKQGGKSQLLNEITMAFHSWAKNTFSPSELVITATYLEGEKMIQIGGDELSRMGRLGEEIKLNPKIFRTLCKMLDFHPEIDLFATRYNTQLQSFHSAHHDRMALATNTLIQIWDRPSYAFPPVNVIPQFLQKVQKEEATILAILPLTPSAGWYPQLQKVVASDPILIAQGRKTFQFPNEYLAPKKQWSRWSWIGILLSSSNSYRTREWRSKTRRKWLRGSGRRTPDRAIRPDGRSFSIGTRQSMVKNRLLNLSLSSALRNG